MRKLVILTRLIKQFVIKYKEENNEEEDFNHQRREMWYGSSH